jgi:hypothetical protein
MCITGYLEEDEKMGVKSKQARVQVVEQKGEMMMMVMMVVVVVVAAVVV